jgi:hypothetical protein
MATLNELKAAVVRQRRDMMEQATRAASLADRLAAHPGIRDIERQQLETVAARFRGVRALLHPIRLESLVPPVDEDAGHDPIT